jgi:hypothetical protein
MLSGALPVISGISLLKYPGPEVCPEYPDMPPARAWVAAKTIATESNIIRLVVLLM